MMFGYVPTVSHQPADCRPLRGIGGHGKSANPLSGPPTPSASQHPAQDIDPGSQPPSGQLDYSRELLPPFLPGSSSTGRPGPLSLPSGGPPYLQPVELPSVSVDAVRNMALSPHGQYSDRTTAYPSPKDSAFDTPKRWFPTLTSGAIPMERPPSSSNSSMTQSTQYYASPERSAKRIRLSMLDDLHQDSENRTLPRAASDATGDANELHGSSPQPPTPSIVSPPFNNPMTPAASSTESEEIRQTWRLTSNQYNNQDRDVRRVSVNSLLLGSPELERNHMMARNHAQVYPDLRTLSPLMQHSSPSRQRANSSTQTESYGLDRGLPDLDIPRNNDAAAINGLSPSQQRELDAWLGSFDVGNSEFGFGLQKREFVFAKGGYYASPVPIKIPRKLEPLPSTLLENPMNLLYFHHFLNHTARILVVHDCSQNPFRTLLPQSRLFQHCDLLNAS